jgi:hypothetical protein
MNDTNSIAWLGLDAHSKNCVPGQLDDRGIETKWWQFATQPQLLIKHVQAIPATDKRLMLEESNLARWIGLLLKPHVQQLVVCDARRTTTTSMTAAMPLPYRQLESGQCFVSVERRSLESSRNCQRLDQLAGNGRTAKRNQCHKSLCSGSWRERFPGRERQFRIE